MVAGKWSLALLVGVIAVAGADEPYVIWRSSALNGYEWVPGSGIYSSRDACDEAIAGRLRRIGGVLRFLRRVGADDTLLHAVGDRMYECRPAGDVPPSAPSRSDPPQSP